MNIQKKKRKIQERKYKAVLSNRIYLTRTEELWNKLLKVLTYKLPPKSILGLPEYHCSMTRVNNNVISIPIGRVDLIPDNYEIIDKRITNATRFPEFKYKLRESQQEILDSIDKDNGSFLLNANPAFGKTFCGVAAAAKLGQKTLIVVHTVYLRQQWENEVKKCLGIKPGIIGSGKFKVDSPIVIANIQSLRTRTKDLVKEFGTILIDECHHVPANIFKDTIDKFHAKYKAGLSATLWRKDGKHVLIYDYVSTKVYNPKDENALKPTVTIIDSGIEFSSSLKKHWGTKVSELVGNPNYIELILNLMEAQVERGHKVLMVSDRIELLKTCHDINPDFKLIIGETEDRTFNSEVDSGILGSAKIFAEGINIPELSSLIIGLPMNNKAYLEQLIGRINRTYPGKPNPEVIDIALRGTLAKKQLAGRINYYSSRGYKIRYI